MYILDNISTFPTLLCYITETLQQILRMLAVLNIKMRDLKERLIKLEDIMKNRVQNPSEFDDSIIAEFLPLTTIEQIKKFDSLLRTTNEAVTQFVSFVYLFTIAFRIEILI